MLSSGLASGRGPDVQNSRVVPLCPGAVGWNLDTHIGSPPLAAAVNASRLQYVDKRLRPPPVSPSECCQRKRQTWPGVSMSNADHPPTR